MKKKIVLVHGYNKDQSDMFVLKKYLEELNYKCLAADLPLTFKKIEDATLIFADKIKEIIDDLEISEKLSLVGHSTGGLVIRYFLSITEDVDRIDKAVLIATPNQGSQLADIASQLSDLMTDFFKTLDSLRKKRVDELGIEKIDDVEIGAIAGNKNNLLLGNLLKEENDGRVQVNSVKYEGLKDFIILPYGHQEIHYQFETARLVDSFLGNGEFKKDYEGADNMLNAKFATLVVSPKLVGELCELIGDMPNVDFPTAGGEVFWNNLAESNGWRLQQNKFTKHCRILDPSNIRKAWGSKSAMEEAINRVFAKQQTQNDGDTSSTQDKEELLATLEKLGELRAKEIITEEEFKRKKEKILRKI